MKRFLYILLLISLFSCESAVFAQINTDRVLDMGRNALYFEDYVLSIQYFNKVIRVKPNLADPYFYRAIAKYSLDDFKGAEADCNKVLEINPFMINVFNLKGILQEKMGNPKAAVEAYTQGLALESTNLNLLFNRGISYMKLKEYSKAVSDYCTVLKYDPNNSGAIGNRGFAKLQAGDTLGCAEDFNKMVAVNSYSISSYTTRGMLYYKQSKFDLALADFDKAIEISTVPNPDLFLGRGAIRYQMDDLRGTMADFDKVVELDPKSSVAYTNRGILRAQIGDTNRAIEDFSRVLALDPTDMMVLFYRGELFMQLRQYSKALNDFNIVAEEYPTYGPLYASRARAKQMLNDAKGAQIDYATAQKLDYDRDERQKIAAKKVAVNGGAAKDTTSNVVALKEKKTTRKKSDKNLKNYNRLAVLDDFEDGQEAQVVGLSTRGKIQNKDIAINLEPIFGLSFFAADSISQRRTVFKPALDAFNNKKFFKSKLVFTNRELEEDGIALSNRYTTISLISKKIEADSTNCDLIFMRAVLFASVLNFNSAIADYDRVLALKPLNSMAYFNRAYARFNMIEVIKTIDVEQQNMPLVVTGNKMVSSESEDSKKSTILDYAAVVNDLDKVTAIDGAFEYAYYNRGFVRSMNRDYEGALSDFSKAIEINPSFAEAYYNRGLTLIYLHQQDKGVFDLSKAGELGLYKAYNVIKRYGVKQSENNESE